MTLLPSVDALRCFVAGARLLHFRSAARAVALSPSAFGQRVRQLETELGATLFARSTRAVVLTEAGLALLPHAERTLAALGECRRIAQGEVGPAPMEITLGTRHELGLRWLLPGLEALERAVPHVSFHVYFGSGADLALRVRTGEIDAGLSSARLADPRLAALRVHRESYVFVGSAALLDATPLRRAADAAQHVLIDASRDLPLFRYFADARGKADPLRFGRVQLLGTVEAILQRVRAGGGVAVLPEYMVRRDLAQGRVRAVMPSVKPAHDFVRLFFRTDDPRRTLFERLASELAAVPLR